MHYFKRNIGDYHKKAGRLSMIEHGAYTLLMDSCYDREQFPTLEQAYDWCWAKSEEEKAAVRFVLEKFFVLKDGVYSQSRIEEEIAKYHKNSRINSKIAKDREEKRRTNRAKSVNEPTTNLHLTTNQEPLTNNQEPINKKTHAKRVVVSKPEDVPDQIWNDFLDVRKKKSAPMTLTALTMICAEADKAGVSLDEALKVCIQYNWQTFDAKWYAERKPKSDTNWEAAGWK